MPEQSADRNRSRGALIIAALLFATALHAQDPAAIALDPNPDLVMALKSTDALTRATAARVALVRSADSLVPQLRERLAAEQDPSAAREEMRALVLLGSDDDVAFAASQLSRFPATIDGDFAEVVGRIGAPRATSLYLKHVLGSRDPAPAINLALWGRGDHATGAASRLLGKRDERAYRDLLGAAGDSRVVIDNGVLSTALDSTSDSIRAETVWYLVEAYAADPQQFPAALRETATPSREGAGAEEAFGREVLRRMLGAELVEQKQALAWLKSAKGRSRVPQGKVVRRFLTLGEQQALQEPGTPDPKRMPPSEHPSHAVRNPDFRLPIRLPAGLAEAILKKTRCGDLWIGLARATVDRAGRVQTLDAKNIGSTAGCQRALEAMLRLSLAYPEQITAGLTSNNLLVVKPGGRSGCYDEDPLSDTIAPRECLRMCYGVKPPEVVKRVEPRFPSSVRREMQSGSVVVIAEAVITKQGCMSDVRLLSQSEWPELNSAAVLALSQWKFKPATLDGVPVDAIFNLTMSFKMN